MKLLPYTQAIGHKNDGPMSAYARGETIEFRNRNNLGEEVWYELTESLVRGEGMWSTMREQFGSVWDWPWLEFRVKMVNPRPFLRFKDGVGLVLSYASPVVDADYRAVPKPVARLVIAHGHTPQVG